MTVISPSICQWQCMSRSRGPSGPAGWCRRSDFPSDWVDYLAYSWPKRKTRHTLSVQLTHHGTLKLFTLSMGWGIVGCLVRAHLISPKGCIPGGPEDYAPPFDKSLGSDIVKTPALTGALSRLKQSARHRSGLFHSPRDDAYRNRRRWRTRIPLGNAHCPSRHGVQCRRPLTYGKSLLDGNACAFGAGDPCPMLSDVAARADSDYSDSDKVCRKSQKVLILMDQRPEKSFYHLIYKSSLSIMMTTRAWHTHFRERISSYARYLDRSNSISFTQLKPPGSGSSFPRNSKAL